MKMRKKLAMLGLAGMMMMASSLIVNADGIVVEQKAIEKRTVAGF